MKKILSLSLASFAFCVALNAEDLKIVGSSTVYPFSTFVVEEYTLLNKKAKSSADSEITVESLGTGGGFKVFCEGKADIADASRPIKLSEFQACKKAGITDIVGIMIGYDGIVLAQNKANPALNITKKELFLALAQEIPQNKKLIPNPYTYWDQINKNLPHRKISIYGPPSSSGTRDTIEELVMSAISKTMPEYKGEYKTLRQDGAYIPVGENDNVTVSKLAIDKDAFGIFGYSFLVNNLDTINAASIDGIMPNQKSIADETYELSRSLFIYINAKKNSKLAFDFAKIYLSDDLAKSGGELEKIGLVPLSDDKLKASYKQVENRKILNDELVKAGKVF